MLDVQHKQTVHILFDWNIRQMKVKHGNFFPLHAPRIPFRHAQNDSMTQASTMLAFQNSGEGL